MRLEMKVSGLAFCLKCTGVARLRRCAQPGEKFSLYKPNFRQFRTLLAKQRISSLLFMLKSNKKPNGRCAPGRQAATDPSSWVPDPHRRSKRNKVPLRYPLPTSRKRHREKRRRNACKKRTAHIESFK